MIEKPLKNTKLMLLDGSTGTMLQRRGMPAGAAPELFCLEHPEVVRKIQEEYLTAGANIIYTPTFGANRSKLRHYQWEKRVSELNQRLAEATVKLAHAQGAWAAGDIGPTGEFFRPFGERSVEEGVGIFAEQMKALEAAGVDLLVVETQLDIQEARLALLAAKENTRLPVVISLTFDEQGRTLTGSDPVTCLTILAALGADGFGINCSTGPEHIVPLVEQIAPLARIPIWIKPNAGLPQVRAGETTYTMGSIEFAAFAETFWKLGVNALGGCCGTTPDHIRELARAVAARELRPAIRPAEAFTVAGPRQTLQLSAPGQGLIRVVGERINPTGKPQLQDELRAGKMERVRALAQEQQGQGADVLDVNVGVDGADEAALLQQAVVELSVASDLPLCLDSSHPEVLEAALRLYPGKALVNSLSGEKAKLEKLLPVIAKYGAACIILPVDDRGISETVEGRLEVLERILQACDKHGVARSQVVVDGLALTVATGADQPTKTLKLIRYASQQLGLHTVIGLSNVSFGLPGRSFLNGAFLAQAAAEGLSLVLANPADEVVMNLKASAEALTGRDERGQELIRRFAVVQKRELAVPHASQPPEERVRAAVIGGNRQGVTSAVEDALAAGVAADRLVAELMIPAIREVGEKYNRREYFLPQLVASAEAMEAGMQSLAPRLSLASGAIKGVGVLATVKGDVHDIGKKIVGLVLRNHGYKIVDLGKSVDEETIVREAEAAGADFIGLSALMTSTMVEMAKVVKLVKARGLAAKVIVGGAVVTQRFADEIGADGYAVDAGRSVEVVERLLAGRPGRSGT
ncbi:MAG: homocysteine S-methyltransferase family protein [candidate division FCPU426 bacterium]